ncbi:gliding motility-associated C-terminal domain-containing protein [Flavobacterium psychroterrae]|uniref:Gliding motility-associated C-terminal domain-containing protein n=1 Tax=Flavobacterium psychroterrae TaxID=2133767 RepID=A0ABS5PBW3_9FLAO|nr:gliding motility-associated C-terminal domain-containing protein [Flavobacterium psychroterrae]MBS7231601.1 gliding motility-associated C-terminal domain-containing protein [Flavobacterium psychroterrae]
MSVTITPEIIPDFDTSLTLCSGNSAPILAITSPNGITGTWNPTAINSSVNGNYIFTPNTGQCATTSTLSVTITPEIIPDFATTLTLCPTDIPPILATTSPNGITGIWNPTVINSSVNGNYIFTPNTGQCAATSNLTVTITPEIIPDFATTLTVCPTDTPPILATTSPNGIIGTWNPTAINSSVNGNYIFTPNTGQCATTSTLSVTITPEIIPDFDTSLTLCSGNSAPILATTSPNGITGTWNPTVINSSVNGNYIFTPNTGQCATTSTLSVTITPEIIPDFATTLTLCPTDIPPVLATTSPNGITGTWNPTAINSSVNGNYIFTPNTGQCATTSTLSVTITPEIIPDFDTSLTLCPTDIPPILATTSPNGITGIWNPTAINSSVNGNYIFTPNTGQCATTSTLSVTSTPEIIPDFDTILTLCPTDIPPILATTSPNGITGTWNPIAINSSVNGNYIFTPNTGQCATTSTLSVTITPEIIPDFDTILTLCPTDIPPILATTSPNGITGTWNPTVINSSVNGNYIFTPNTGQCAAKVTLAVNVSSFKYSVSQECIDNNYFIKVIPNSDFKTSDFNYSWIDDNGNQIGYNDATFNFTEYSERLNNKPLLPLQLKVIVSLESCEIEQVFQIADNLCGIPNVVSPNDDGINDNFNLSSYNVNNLKIFNRYGTEVYNFQGKYENQWYGQWRNGKLPTGTYFYIISTQNGESKAGWVFLSY